MHVQVAPLWFAAQFTFNVSLSETTVTSNTILASTSSLFTYALSCMLLLEAFVVSKLLFIALAMGGERPICHGIPKKDCVCLCSLYYASSWLFHAQVFCIVQDNISQALYRQSIDCCRYDYGDVWGCKARGQHAAEHRWRGLVGTAIRTVLCSIYGE